jgi:cobalamin biosynthesis Co2+ chelatase CbiK
MINNIEDFNLEETDSLETMESKIQDKLGISIETIKQSLSSYLKDKAEEISEEIINIIPYGEYDQIIDDKNKMINFLKEEASKIENWKLFALTMSDVNKSLLQFILKNSAVDEGDVLEGHVLVSKSGVIRHTFVQFD